MLTDEDGKTISEYGLRDPDYIGGVHYGIPRPALFVVDENRRVVWSRVETDYRERPSLDEIRAGVRRLES